MTSSDKPATIFVTYKFVGFHHWQHATGEREYLASRHRHNFGVRVEMGVTHDDRDVEFHDLIDVCKSYLNDVPENGQSCEHMARHLHRNLVNDYYGVNRHIAVTVDEDGECGATVTT
jgi:hypothetical protein